MEKLFFYEVDFLIYMNRVFMNYLEVMFCGIDLYDEMMSLKVDK